MYTPLIELPWPLILGILFLIGMASVVFMIILAKKDPADLDEHEMKIADHDN